MVDISCLLCHYLLCSLSFSAFFLFSSVLQAVVPTSHELLQLLPVYNCVYSVLHLFTTKRQVVFFRALAFVSWLPSHLLFLSLTTTAIICYCLDSHIEKKWKKDRTEKERVCLLIGPEHPISPLLLHTLPLSLMLITCL